MCSLGSDPELKSMTTALARRQTRSTVRPVRRFEIEREVTSRRTSPWGHSTFAMVRPTRLALRSRASVSVSGNSGTATVFAPADVTAELTTVETHLVCAKPAAFLRLGKRRRDAGHGE